jgi:hypothetical protein
MPSIATGSTRRLCGGGEGEAGDCNGSNYKVDSHREFQVHQVD